MSPQLKMLLNNLLLLTGLVIALGYPIGHSHSRFHRHGVRHVSWQDSNIEARLLDQAAAADEAPDPETVDSAVVKVSVHDASTDDEPQSLFEDMNKELSTTDVLPSQTQTARISTSVLDK